MDSPTLTRPPPSLWVILHMLFPQPKTTFLLCFLGGEVFSAWPQQLPSLWASPGLVGPALGSPSVQHSPSGQTRTGFNVLFDYLGW